ncbi:NAD-dependent succinate-semialdehyde dehydrogenase [Streptomyces sp. NPDC048277]|uniref:NAD-dependent succinate-semialdehyde dehydrogenase n=1 Tax=Streptomyces sp. NPDC048277 TaxID=3155027 RepID=UPI00340ADC0C
MSEVPFVESIFIDGTWRAAESGTAFVVTDPANGREIATVADGGMNEVRAAIDAAHAALPDWSRRTAYERSEVLYRAHELMLERAEELARLMTTEQGKPLRAARTEVRYAADFLIWFAEEAKRVYGRTIPSARADQRFIVQHRPVGVVGAVTPWNYPISMITRKVGPALAAGCTVVLKPAETTPLCAVEVFKILEEAGVPPGVVNLVTLADPSPAGTEFTTNPKVAKLTFTGSTAVGRMLAEGAGRSLKRISLELGGHAPFIVFDDADPVHAAKGAAAIKMLNTGQACIVPNRYFVHASLATEFLDVFTARIDRMKAGNGHQEGVTVGPLIDAASVDRMERQVTDAVERGAKVLAGGKRLTDREFAGGNFYAPTVLSEVTPEMTIFREETFGPVAPVIVFDDDDDVIAMANDTTYGLASYVYTSDLGRALRTCERLDFGMVGVNDINPTSAAAPFGGVKDSGIGREGAQEGIHEYLETRLVGLSI